MALVFVGLAIPDEPVVTYTCSRRDRVRIRIRCYREYQDGGMNAVRDFLARATGGDGITRDRET